MARRLKVATLAVFVVALVGSANPDAVLSSTFSIDAGQATVTGSQESTNVLKVTGGQFSCSLAIFHGNVTGPSLHSITLEPTYEDCHEETFGISAKITGFGGYGEEHPCHYSLDPDGTVDLVCQDGGEVTIDAATCIVHIPGQNGIGSVDYVGGTGYGGKDDITVNLTIDNLEATHTDGFLCPAFVGSGTTAAEMSGSITLEAESSETELPVDLSGGVLSPPPAFTSAAVEATVRGWQEPNALKVTNQSLGCEEASFHGSIAGGAAQSIELHPAYTNCRLNSGISAQVTGFGHYGEEKACHYVLHASGNVDLVCDPGAEVTVDAATCIVHIPGQTGIGEVDFTNGTRNGKSDITADLTVDSIDGSHTDGFLCPFSSGGTFTDGAMSGSITLEAESVATESPVDLWRDEPSEGPQPESVITSVAGMQITGEEGSPTTLDVTGGRFRCANASLQGTAPVKAIEEFTVSASFTGCSELTSGLAAKVTGFGGYGEEIACDLRVHSAGTVDIYCPPGGEVTVEAGTCVVHIPAQVGIGNVEFINGTTEGGDDYVTMSLKLSSLIGTHTDGSGCSAFNGSGFSFYDGLLTGSFILRGWIDGNPADLTWDRDGAVS